MPRLLLASALVALVPLAARAQTLPPSEVADDLAFVKAANVATDGPALLAYLRQQTFQGAERQQVEALVKKLDDKSLAKREKAAADLVACGPKALPVLRAALPGATLEVRLRIERCLKQLEKLSAGPLAGAVVRLVRHQRPDKAAAVLLDYLTSTPDENVEEEVVYALAAVGFAQGKPGANFEAALADSVPLKRSAAALVLGRFGTRQQRATVHLLLDDPSPLVRLRAAQGLLLGRDRSAIPALIALLLKAPAPIAEQAEDLLQELAGVTAPATSLADEGDARLKCYKAWRAWWEPRQTKIDLARTDLDSLANNDGIAKARAVARQFIVAAFKFDKPAIRKTSDIPFVIAGLDRIDSRETWEQLLGANGQTVPRDPKFTVQKVISVEEYAKTAQPMEAPVIEQMKKQPVRVVVGQLDETGQGRLETFVMFVRVTGARARVIGLGAPQLPPPEKTLTR
jgi:HEAT repeat protein